MPDLLAETHTKNNKNVHQIVSMVTNFKRMKQTMPDLLTETSRV
jgi:hypothetical protein